MWTYFGLSYQNKRQQNMDGILLTERTICGDPVLLAVLCDGVGGTTCGAKAASGAISVMKKWFVGLEGFDRLGIRFQNCILDINNSIAKYWNKKEVQAATTLSALLLVGDRYYLVHVGDSRIYAVGRSLLLLTNDQKEDGRLSQYIGMQGKIRPQYGEGECGANAFMLCSDGFYNRMKAEYVMRIMRESSRRGLRMTMERAAQDIIRQGERDNISLAIIKRKDEEKKRE